MTNSIYLTTIEPYSGKSLVSLGITELLLRRTPNVGIFRPVIEVPPDQGHDKNIDLLITYYDLDIDYEDTYAFYRHEVADMLAEGRYDDILDTIIPLFDHIDFIRTHGDCHRGNIIHRPEEGIFLIDYDDMMTAPPAQDVWMLLPGNAEECRRELNLLLEVYEDFRAFNWSTLRLIEPLRVMRMLYFLAWCARQIEDPNFTRKYPDWGSEAFWRREVTDLERQRDMIEQHL